MARLAASSHIRRNRSGPVARSSLPAPGPMKRLGALRYWPVVLMSRSRAERGDSPEYPVRDTGLARLGQDQHAQRVPLAAGVESGRVLPRLNGSRAPSLDDPGHHQFCALEGGEPLRAGQAFPPPPNFGRPDTNRESMTLVSTALADRQCMMTTLEDSWFARCRRRQAMEAGFSSNGAQSGHISVNERARMPRRLGESGAPRLPMRG